MKKWFLVFICLTLLGTGGLFSQEDDRYFDTAGPGHDEIRLAILYPSVGSIRALDELRKNNLFSLEQLTVIGVYHEKERTDYEISKEFVRENQLEWVKFHRISGEINRKVLFQKNGCTEEFEKIFRNSDGIMFFGGGDVPPYIYSEKTSLLTRIVTPYRHFLEISLIFHLLGGFQDRNFRGFLESRSEFPIMGICLGCQSLNVGTGGTLTQDIWAEKYGKKYVEDVIELGKENWHKNPFSMLYPEEDIPYRFMHRIKLKEKGMFCLTLGFKKEDTPYVLSSHHQMVEKLGKGFRVAATSLDGNVVEAIEHEKYPNVLGVQFHPENPNLWDPELKVKTTPQDEEMKSLKSILEGNPPSFKFHQEIWSWFVKKLKESHQKE